MDSDEWIIIQQAAPRRTNSTKTIDDYNEEESLRRLAPLIYLGLLLIIGVIGNTMVLIVYPLRLPKSTHRTFIVGLAMTDLLVCLITIPFEIVEMRFQYTFYNVIACKVFRTFSSWFSLSSILVLIGMSYEKYRRICKPMKKQITVKICRIYVGCVFLISSLFVWPSLLLGGIRLVKLGGNITGHDCSLSDKYAKTSFPVIAEGTLLLMTLLCIGVLIIVYSLIGRCILVHSRFRRQFQINSIVQLTETSNIRFGNKQESNPNNGNRTAHLSTNDPQHSIRKLTRIAFVVSIVFILSYLPHLVISFMTAIKGKFLLPPGPVVSAVMPILARSFIINNVASPIIYGFMDIRFRKNCKLFLRYILFCRNCK